MKPFLLKIGEMLVDRGERGQAEPMADFLQARRIAVLLDEFVEVIEDFALAFGERLQRASWPGEDRGENPGDRRQSSQTKGESQPSRTFRV